MNAARLIFLMFTLCVLSPVSKCSAAVRGSCDPKEKDDSFLLGPGVDGPSHSVSLGIQSLVVQDGMSLQEWFVHNDTLLSGDECSPLLGAGYLLRHFLSSRDVLPINDARTPVSIAGEKYTPLEVALHVGDFDHFDKLALFYEDSEMSGILKKVMLNHYTLLQWVLFEKVKVDGTTLPSAPYIAKKINADQLKEILTNLSLEGYLQDFELKLFSALSIVDATPGKSLSGIQQTLSTWIECIEKFKADEANSNHGRMHQDRRYSPNTGEMGATRTPENGSVDSSDDETGAWTLDDCWHPNDGEDWGGETGREKFIEHLGNHPKTLKLVLLHILKLDDKTSLNQPLAKLFEVVKSLSNGKFLNSSLLFTLLTHHLLDKGIEIIIQQDSNLLKYIRNSIKILDVRSAQLFLNFYKQRVGSEKVKEMLRNFLSKDECIDVDLACRFISSIREDDGAMFALDGVNEFADHSRETCHVVLDSLKALAALFAQYDLDESEIPDFITTFLPTAIKILEDRTIELLYQQQIL